MSFCNPVAGWRKVTPPTSSTRTPDAFLGLVGSSGPPRPDYALRSDPRAIARGFEAPRDPEKRK